MTDNILRKLQLHDKYVCQIIHASPETSLYKFDAGNNKWEKLDVDGTFFLCKRTLAPFYCFVISSMSGDGIVKERLTKDVMIQIQIPFLLYKRSGEVKGILFQEERECVKVGNSMNSLLSEINDASPRDNGSNSMRSPTSSLEPGSSVITHQNQSSNPIPQAQVSATSPGQNSIIRMLHSAAAKHSPPTSISTKPDANRMRPQSIATPHQQIAANQNNTNSTIHNSVVPNTGIQNKSTAHWSNKTHSISVDYLFKSLRNSGQRSPTRTSSPKQTPLTPTQPVVPVPGAARASGNCLTLSEVEQQAMVEASECLRQQLGISRSDNGVMNSVTGRGDCRPSFQPSNSTKGIDSIGSGGKNIASAIVAVDDGDDDEGLVLTPSMMEQAVISPSINNVFPGPSLENVKESANVLNKKETNLADNNIESVALNKSQLKEALVTLIQQDDDFIARVHEAYIRNLQRHLK